MNGVRFAPNVAARPGTFAGAAARVATSWGEDPRGLRATAGTRLEAAGGESAYGRVAADASIARAFGRLQSSVTAGAGVGAGELPPQRLWYLGGAYTVRGHAIGAQSGDAFWFGRGEVALGSRLARPVVFADVGWAGSRDEWSRPGRALSGAGAGLSMLDGLVRLDVARGLERGGRWRAELYLDVR